MRGTSTRPRRLDRVPIMAADYDPSDDLKAAIRAFDEAEQQLEARKKALREAIGREMLEHPEATTGKLVKYLKWSEETLRGIAREFKVPRKRPPTVRSIKDTPES